MDFKFISSGSEMKIACVFFVDEDVEITYSYWDGSGHRRTLKVQYSAQQDLVFC